MNRKRPPVSEETRRRLSEAAKRRFRDPAERQKISDKLTGSVTSEETRRKQAEAANKRYEDPANRAKCGRPGKSMSDEHRQRISEAQKRVHEQRRAAGLPHKPFGGKRHSKETKKSIADTLTGRTLTEEHKQRISESSKGKSRKKSTDQQDQ